MKFELKKQIIEYTDKKTNTQKSFAKYYLESEDGTCIIYVKPVIDKDKNGNPVYRNSILMKALAKNDLPF